MDDAALRAHLLALLRSASKRMTDPAVALVSRIVAAERCLRRRLDLWRFDYSRGRTKAALRNDLLEVLDVFDAWRHLFERLLRVRSPQARESALPGSLGDPVSYRNLLHLLSLCRLFDFDSRLSSFALLLQDAPACDRLLMSIARGGSVSGGSPAPATHALLEQAWAADDEAYRRMLVCAYCESNAVAPTQGMNPDLDGGWLFEAAAAWPRDVPPPLAWNFPADLLGLRVPPIDGVRAKPTSGRARLGAATALSVAVAWQPHAMAQGFAAEAAASIAQDPASGGVERGLASWYGPGFQDRPTANGERYDMALFTAAHRSLPLPSFVHVRNLRNGRQVVVVVNDRGPYVEGRSLDLSLGAARQLGMVEPGVVEVEMTLLTREQVQAWAQPSVAPADDGVVQVRTAAGVLGIAPHAGGLAALAGERVAAATPVEPALRQLAPMRAGMQRVAFKPLARPESAPLAVPAQLLIGLHRQHEAPESPDAGSASPDFAGGLQALEGRVTRAAEPAPPTELAPETVAESVISYPVREAQSVEVQVLPPLPASTRPVQARRLPSHLAPVVVAAPSLAPAPVLQTPSLPIRPVAATPAQTLPTRLAVRPPESLLDRLRGLSERGWQGITHLLGMRNAEPGRTKV